MNAVNHGSVVETIGEDDTVWKFGTESGESGVIGDVARGKDECGFFTMEIDEFFREREMNGSVSGDVTRPPAPAPYRFKVRLGRRRRRRVSYPGKIYNRT